MAQNISAQVAGGKLQHINASTVREVFEKLELSGSYSATVNGETVDMDATLSDYQFVTFAEKVKGGLK